MLGQNITNALCININLQNRINTVMLIGELHKLYKTFENFFKFVQKILNYFLI